VHLKLAEHSNHDRAFESGPKIQIMAVHLKLAEHSNHDRAFDSGLCIAALGCSCVVCLIGPLRWLKSQIVLPDNPLSPSPP
jgi:hypothetical protein